MNDIKVNHLGYIVKEINCAVNEFENIGFKFLKPIIEDKKRNMLACLMVKDGYVIEIISPMNKKSEVYSLSRKSFSGMPYHLCFETKNISGTLLKLKKRGYVIVKEPDDAILFDGRKVAFLFSRNIGLVELLSN